MRMTRGRNSGLQGKRLHWSMFLKRLPKPQKKGKKQNFETCVREKGEKATQWERKNLLIKKKNTKREEREEDKKI